ncbi:MAG: aminoacyl-tRNA hydrolase [Vulcanimicrobiaceae bacterium]
MRLVVGLGNPGQEYAATRHNLGYLVTDELARRWGLHAWRTKDSARQAADAARKALLVQPTSFMNNSGVPVRLIASWYRTAPHDILVVADDLDLPFGALRMRVKGGHGGHNGLRSIIATVGDEFPRIRIGIGRPEFDSIDHVLSTFQPRESEHIAGLVSAAAEGVERWLAQGPEAAMQFVNSAHPLPADLPETF